MRGRSPVTVWRPPARAHTLAHTQSNCRVDGSAAWALRAVQRRVGTSRIAFYNPCFRLHGCVLRDARPPGPGTGVLRSCRCRPRGAREAYNAGERTALRAASAAAPPDATNFAEARFSPGFRLSRYFGCPTDRRGRPRDRRLGLVKRACGSSRAERQSGSPHARRGPGYSVRRSARRQASELSLPRVSRLATTNSDVTARPIIPTHAANPARNREPTVRGASHTRRRRRSTRV